MHRYFYARPGRTAGGPITVAELKGLRAQGKIGSGTLICRDGEEKWVALEDVLKVEDPLGAIRAVASSEPGGGVGWLLLTFGQIVSALGCLAAPAYPLIALSEAAPVRERVRDAPDPTLWIVGGAVLGFLYSAAMFVVFTRCKRIPDE